MSAQRLDKWIANTCGLSRKEVKDFVRAGRVCVNGETVHNAGMQIDPDSDVLCLDGKTYTAQQHIYIMLHKPLGVVSASRDRTQKTVLTLCRLRFSEKACSLREDSTKIQAALYC